MKIPKDAIISTTFECAWDLAAANIAMETGIFVEVIKEYDNANIQFVPVQYYPSGSSGTLTGTSASTSLSYQTRLTRIYFKIGNCKTEIIHLKGK